MNRKPQSKTHEIVLPEHLLPLASALETCATPQSVCMALAEFFHVQSSEVALLRLEDNALLFLHPEHLRSTGAIPVPSSAVAAHTAMSKKAEIFNNFALIKHASIFEIIRPSDADIADQQAPLPIQKLMSVPIVGHGQSTALAVIQVSHKGAEPRFTRDFSREELHDLELVAQLLAAAPFLSHDRSTQHPKLRG
ncbi:MAG: hypothetical protein DMG77_10640 [Acidobacteria bacterium]|nr:MAG: hypothetical protein DMG77_10640 [Acidobacteriota bacterium]